MYWKSRERCTEQELGWWLKGGKGVLLYLQNWVNVPGLRKGAGETWGTPDQTGLQQTLVRSLHLALAVATHQRTAEGENGGEEKKSCESKS